MLGLMTHQIESGLYLHYSGLIVFMLGVARHSETEEKFVAYIPLGAKKGPRITVRPYEMFFENVTIDGKEVPRFKYIGTEMPGDLAEKYRSMSEWGRPTS